MWLLTFVIMVREVNQTLCFDFKDTLMGGTQGDTSFSALDYDSTGNLVIGGSS